MDIGDSGGEGEAGKGACLCGIHLERVVIIVVVFGGEILHCLHVWAPQIGRWVEVVCVHILAIVCIHTDAITGFKCLVT